MEGKRFAVGLFAGLLLGVAIITASGGLVTLSPGTSPAAKNTQEGSVLTTTALATETTTTLQSGITSTGVPSYVAAGNKSLTSTTTTPAAPGSNSVNGVQAGTTSTSATPAYPSRVQSITQQPLLTDSVVFVPVLVAFLLGALLYRASSRGKEHLGEG